MTAKHDELQKLCDRTIQLYTKIRPYDKPCEGQSIFYLSLLLEESGELSQACRKYWGRKLHPDDPPTGDSTKVMEEIGDVLLVMFGICWMYDIALTDAIKYSLNKLECRVARGEKK